MFADWIDAAKSDANVRPVVLAAMVLWRKGALDAYIGWFVAVAHGETEEAVKRSACDDDKHHAIVFHVHAKRAT